MVTTMGSPATTVPSPAAGDPARRRGVRIVRGAGDLVFRTGALGAGVTVLAITGAVGVFLLIRAFTALKVAKFSFLTTAKWEPDVHRFGVAGILSGTVIIALIAVTVSTPLAIATALFISEIAPGRLKRLLIALVDLMFAVPSVIFGLWGWLALEPHVVDVARFMATWLGWIPIFHVNHFNPSNPNASLTVLSASSFVAGLVVALMIAPIQCSLMREVFAQAPAGEREGALALGSTRWGMIRTVVLPYGRGGMIGATMLSLGRALGETIAVYLIISPILTGINTHILQSGAISVASLIALRYSEASSFGLSALFAAGLALFTLTLVINFSAASIIARSRSGAMDA